MNKEANKLFNEGKFLETIELVKDSIDIDDMFLYIISLVCINNINAANVFISKHMEILLQQPERLIETHISMFLAIGDFISAKNYFDSYEELPYISQSVEETLIRMKNEIAKKEKENSKKDYSLSLDKIKEQLSSGDPLLIQHALTMLVDYDIKSVVPTLEKILLNKELAGPIRRLALIMMQEKEYSKSVKFFYEETDEIIDVIPTNLSVALHPDYHKKFLSKLNFTKDVTVKKFFKDSVEMFTLLVYPKKVTNSDNEIFYGALLKVYDDLSIDNDELVEMMIKEKIDINTAINIKKRIQKFGLMFNSL